MPAGRRPNAGGRRLAAVGNPNSGPSIAAAVTRAVSKLLGSGGRPPPPQRRPKRRPNAAAANANLRSIPRNVASKETRFAGGAMRTSTFAARGHGYYDAFVHRAEMTSLASSVGPCTPIEGFARFVIPGQAGITDLPYLHYSGSGSEVMSTHGLTTNVSFLVFNPGASDDIIARYYCLTPNPSDPTNAVVKMQEYGATAFEGLADNPTTNRLTDASHNNEHLRAYQLDEPIPPTSAAGRVESIPLRGSLRMRNITESLAVGGEIRVMRYNGGLKVVRDAFGAGEGVTASSTNGGAATVTGTQAGPDLTYGATAGGMNVDLFLEIVEMMRDTKRAHTVQGAQLLTEFQANTYPADAVRSHTFREDTSFEEAMRRPKYCSLIVLIEDFKSSSAGVSNTFSFSTVVQRAARFSPGSLLHSKQTTLRTNAQAHASGVAGEYFKPAMAAVSTAINSGLGQALVPYAANLAGRGLQGMVNNQMAKLPASLLPYAEMAEGGLFW